MLGPAARWLLAAVSAATLLLTGCTSGSSDPKPTSVATTTSAASSPSSRSPTPTPPATKVPVDQIPPGNPASWVPAGVPTAAKYKEPGDVVPMFTRAMFQRTDTGALAMAGYY
ncbi:MAG: hypothetical protein ABJA87_01620, partial [bacterium]